MPDDAAAVAVVTWFGGALRDALRPALGGRLLLTDRRALTLYLQADMGFRSEEVVRVLFLDARNRLMADEVVARGTPTGVAIGTRHILARALEIGAAGLILVHNHPSGEPAPSGADVVATVAVRDLCRALDIVLHDHLIVGRGRTASMRLMGVLDP